MTAPDAPSDALAEQQPTGDSSSACDGSATSPRWRVGRKVPINVYEGDRPVCQCQAAMDAKRIVAAINASSSGALRERGVRVGDVAVQSSPAAANASTELLNTSSQSGLLAAGQQEAIGTAHSALIADCDHFLDAYPDKPLLIAFLLQVRTALVSAAPLQQPNKGGLARAYD